MIGQNALGDTLSDRAIADVVAEIAAASATLGRALHPKTAANLADLVRMMNCYYWFASANLTHVQPLRTLILVLSGSTDEAPSCQQRNSLSNSTPKSVLG
jgi:hypothetical protein